MPSHPTFRGSPHQPSYPTGKTMGIVLNVWEMPSSPGAVFKIARAVQGCTPPPSSFGPGRLRRPNCYTIVCRNSHQIECAGMRTSWKFPMRSLAVTLSFLMISSAWDAQAQTMPTLLNIVVVEGDGAINNIRQRVARDPVVRVEDENHKPIAGAAVVFTLPTEGATGDFAGQKTITVTTDTKGLAVGKSMKLNPIPGKVPIHVTASYRGLSARMTINQVAVVPPGEKAGTSASSGHHGALIGVLVALGAAAAGGGAYFATHGSKTSTSSTPPPTGPVPIGITPGAGGISGGH